MKSILSIIVFCCLSLAVQAQVNRDQTANIIFLVSGKIKSGQLQAFQVLIKDLVAATKKEAGAMDYEYYISSDNTAFQIVERYRDSAAALEHSRNFRENFSKRFGEAVEVTGFALCGNASDELKTAMGRQAMPPAGGFSR